MSKKKINANVIGSDFTTVLTKEWLVNKTKFSTINHDISIEIEDIEEILGRCLNDLETDSLKKQFYAMVLKK